ncbi:hypothetical protein ACVIYL_004534 [Bradyrhizobium sp. USDA 3315]
MRTRRERAERLKRDRRDFFDQYGADARAVLEALLQKYADHGAAQFVLPGILKVPPLAGFGNPSEIARRFGGPDKLRAAVNEMSGLLYAAYESTSECCHMKRRKRRRRSRLSASTV